MKVLSRLLVLILSIAISGCAQQHCAVYAPMQSDGWSAQPISIERRFAPDADLDPVTGTPIGDKGYNLYFLTYGGNWNYRSSWSFLFSVVRRPWGHSWLILESPKNRIECGQSGDYGEAKPRYHEGVFQRMREGHPNPIAYLWETMSDGRCEIGRPEVRPTFVWRMPITQRRYRSIHEYLMHRDDKEFSIRFHNCTDFLMEVAALTGVDFIHRIRLTFPPRKRFFGRMLHVWTDPQYNSIEYSTTDVLEADLRHLAQFGIGYDATKWYRSLPAPKRNDFHRFAEEPQRATD